MANHPDPKEQNDAKHREDERLKQEADNKRREDERRKHDEDQARRNSVSQAGTRVKGSLAGGERKDNPVNRDGTKEAEEQNFSREEIRSLAGDLGNYELGYLELDEQGTPTGAATSGTPPVDTPAAPVVGHAPLQFDEVVTPSGAPVTKHMNPSTELWDSGMLARNPLPDRREQPAHRAA
jgi:hypothetical protein